MHGTSQAAPHVAGVVAVTQQLAEQELGRRLTVDEFTALLRDSAATIHDGDDEEDNVTNTDLDFLRLDMFGLATGLVGPVDDPPVEWIIDDGDSGYSETGSGRWNAFPVGYGGDSRWNSSGTGTDQASWTFTGLVEGTYALYTTWPEGYSRPDNAPYTILDGSTELATVRKNQQLAPDDTESEGWWWESLGEYTVTSGTLVVRVSDDANPYYVFADAVRVVKLATLAPPDLSWSSPLAVPSNADAGVYFTADRTYEVTEEVVGPDF